MSATDKAKRLARGRQKPQALFPVGGSANDVPSDYLATLADLKNRIRNERLRITLSANAAMILLYWDIGRVILDRQDQQGWGAKVVDRLAHDLRLEFPDMNGLGPRNLLFMRAFAQAYGDREVVKQLVSQIPWGHNIHILQKIKDPADRLWYVQESIKNGWSRNILTLQMERNLHSRQGKAANNFAIALPPADSDMAAQVFKDPYLFDFLGTADPRKEREVEQALIDHVQHFLLELGAGFAFVGRQVLLEVGDSARLALLSPQTALLCRH